MTSTTQGAPYQLMPDMSEEEYQALKKSIKKHGVWHPLEFDEEGNIVDGHHRYRAFSELIEEGYDVPMYDKITRKYENDQQKFEYALRMNVERRQITPEMRKELAYKLRLPPYSYGIVKIGELLGVSIATVSRDLGSLSDAEKAEIAQHSIKGADGREYTTQFAPKVYMTGQQQLRNMQMDVINSLGKTLQTQAAATASVGTAGVAATNGATALAQVQAQAAQNRVQSLVSDEAAQQRILAFAWYGGKASHLNWLLQLLPPCKHFVDVFGGSAAVLMNRQPPSPIETYNDLDSGVVNFFKVLRDQPEELIRLLRLTPFSREERRLAFEARHSKEGSNLERARRFFVLARQTRSGLAQKEKGMLNSWRFARDSVARGVSDAIAQWESGLDGLAAVAARMSRVQIDNYPALKVLDLYDTAETLFYCDPPYVADTRRADKRNVYAFEMTDQDHTELAHALHRIKGKAAVSGYPGTLYDDLYKDWYKVLMPASTTAGKRRDLIRADGERMECLWTNYPLRAEDVKQAEEALAASPPEEAEVAS